MLDIFKKQKGFTLIELILVIIILGILAATVAPKYIDLKREALNRSLESAVSAVRGALWMTIAQREMMGQLPEGESVYPTVAQLAGNLEGGSYMDDQGVDIEINGVTYIVRTYGGPETCHLTKDGCSPDCISTLDPGVDTVRCVSGVIERISA